MASWMPTALAGGPGAPPLYTNDSSSSFQDELNLFSSDPMLASSNPASSGAPFMSGKRAAQIIDEACALPPGSPGSSPEQVPEPGMELDLDMIADLPRPPMSEPELDAAAADVAQAVAVSTAATAAAAAAATATSMINPSLASPVPNMSTAAPLGDVVMSLPTSTITGSATLATVPPASLYFPSEQQQQQQQYRQQPHQQQYQQPLAYSAPQHMRQRAGLRQSAQQWDATMAAASNAAAAAAATSADFDALAVRYFDHLVPAAPAASAAQQRQRREMVASPSPPAASAEAHQHALLAGLPTAPPADAGPTAAQAQAENALASLATASAVSRGGDSSDGGASSGDGADGAASASASSGRARRPNAGTAPSRLRDAGADSPPNGRASGGGGGGGSGGNGGRRRGNAKRRSPGTASRSGPSRKRAVGWCLACAQAKELEERTTRDRGRKFQVCNACRKTHLTNRIVPDMEARLEMLARLRGDELSPDELTDLAHRELIKSYNDTRISRILTLWLDSRHEYVPVTLVCDEYAEALRRICVQVGEALQQPTEGPGYHVEYVQICGQTYWCHHARVSAAKLGEFNQAVTSRLCDFLNSQLRKKLTGDMEFFSSLQAHGMEGEDVCVTPEDVKVLYELQQ